MLKQTKNQLVETQKNDFFFSLVYHYETNTFIGWLLLLLGQSLQNWIRPNLNQCLIHLKSSDWLTDDLILWPKKSVTIKLWPILSILFDQSLNLSSDMDVQTETGDSNGRQRRATAAMVKAAMALANRCHTGATTIIINQLISLFN